MAKFVKRDANGESVKKEKHLAIAKRERRVGIYKRLFLLSLSINLILIYFLQNKV